MSTLEALRSCSTIVVDSGDFESIGIYNPVDATTNPSLILSASKMPKYSHLLDKAISMAKLKHSDYDEQVKFAIDCAFILFGCEILKVIPGRVSTEVDARLSFDKEKQIEKAKFLISLYEEFGVNKEKVLIKLSSTWEGIQAAKVLETDFGIHCNMTLLFSFAQAVACAKAGVTLVSPFVGRIYDWYVAKKGISTFPRLEDPGVMSVTDIYNYYKQSGYKTEIMGASFRNVEQILGLTGCDLLTISPSLLQKLASMTEVPAIYLSPKKAAEQALLQTGVEDLDESTFRWQLNEEEMATEKLSDGIRKFAADTRSLEALIRERLR